jgi:hypothetical protein
MPGLRAELAIAVYIDWPDRAALITIVNTGDKSSRLCSLRADTNGPPIAEHPSFPISMLYEPVETLIPAELPTAMLKEPVVLFKSAPQPVATSERHGVTTP